MKKYISILLCSIATNAFGQFTTPEAISSGGDSYSQPFGKMEVTIGETVIETLNENNIFLTQGFQQSHFFAVTIEENTLSEDIDFSVFPNPATDELNILWNIDETVLIFLYDLKSNLLYVDNMEKTSRIKVADYASGAYLLRLSAGIEQKTVIIQKLK
ncbi:MAG TPA: T9SS type A sorting domain-containing protein [Bacteroidales bacterium]|nr:T9SS type A sorting domain-containing protein [Bacteroidales bacterium]